jgi:predicted molibdopterin-dependent oxidoreductase YjgC
VGLARSEWRVFGDVARRVDPDLGRFFDWSDNLALRTEIAEVVPAYAGIETLAATGDAVQWGGRHLCADGVFPTPSGRGRFPALEPPAHPLADGEFTVATRRGKQFNSMVFGEVDPLTGAERDAVYIRRVDAEAAGLAEGDRVVLRSATGEYVGRLRFARLPSRSLQVHWPEGNVLIAAGAEHRDEGSLSRRSRSGRPWRAGAGRRGRPGRRRRWRRR